MLSLVSRVAMTALGLCSSSEISDTITGVTAAAGAVPPFQNCETTTAATADEMLAMASVRIESLRSASRAWRLCEAMPTP